MLSVHVHCTASCDASCPMVLILHIECSIITYKVRVKVKVTLVQALRLCTGRTAHRESRGIALFFHDQR
jgi:hypothetical protein